MNRGEPMRFPRTDAEDQRARWRVRVGAHRWRHPEYRPTVEISNFKDYGRIAAAYEEEAVKQAVVSDRICKLAAEITQGMTSKCDQAEKIYARVAKNISFAGDAVRGADLVVRAVYDGREAAKAILRSLEIVQHRGAESAAAFP